MKRTKLIVLIMFSIIQIQSIFAVDNQIGINVKKNQLIAPNAISYQWYLDGKLLVGENNKTLICEKSGSYKVLITYNTNETSELKVVVKVSNGVVRKLFVIGDSTASTWYNDVYPETGWAQVLQSFFNKDSVIVLNRAISGTSSKSFLTKTSGWPYVLKNMGKGDYLFIQFGHNDQKSGSGYTDPYTTYQDYLSMYIDTALARGAYPVLLTSVQRNLWNGGVIDDSHGNYPPAMRALAKERNIPLIDLHAKTTQRWEELGQTYVTNNIYMNIPANIYKSYPEGKKDNSHFQQEGAYEVCKMVLEGFEELIDNDTIKFLADNTVKAGLVKVVPDEGLIGMVYNQGVYTEGSVVTLRPSVNAGYAVSKWMEGSSVISDDINYTFTADTNMRTIKVFFDAGVKVEGLPSPFSAGIVTGAGTYVIGKEINLTATPYEGYRFVSWTMADSIISTDTTLTIITGSEAVSCTANFEIANLVKDRLTDNNIKVFQISTDQLMINSEFTINKTELYDLSGKKVLINLDQNFVQYLNIGSLASGIYIIKLNTRQRVFTGRIYISK